VTQMVNLTPPDRHGDCLGESTLPESVWLVGDTIVAAYTCPECRAVFQTGWNLRMVQPQTVKGEWSR
jgi:hypothetical protein